MAGGAGGKDVERRVLGLHLRCRRRVAGGLAVGQFGQVLDGEQIGHLGAAVHDVLDQIAFGDKHFRVEQTDAVGQNFVALVVVQHPGHRSALDHRQHGQHGVRGIAQHDADHLTAAHTAVGQHRGVAVSGLVGLPVGDLLFAKAEEDTVAVAVGAVLKNLADRRF